MRQLSGQDASFIYSERPHAPTHITSISVYDPSTAPGGAVTFKGILAHLEARLHLARAFRQKVVRVPLDLDHPYWVEDSEFDLEYHVRHIALPKPGDWRQFCIQAARLHARPLDLSKPLWELYVIEGLDNVEDVPPGAFAFVLKIHHAAVDGKSGVEMITAIHSQTPEVVDPPPPATTVASRARSVAARSVRAGDHQRRSDAGADAAPRRPAHSGRRASRRRGPQSGWGGGGGSGHPLQRAGDGPPRPRCPHVPVRRPATDTRRRARGDRQRRRARRRGRRHCAPTSTSMASSRARRCGR